VTATTEFHREQVGELIKENLRIRQREIAVKIGISQEYVGHIIDIL
jgi:predicted transcriptional regulator